MRSFLLDRVDSALASGHVQVEHLGTDEAGGDDSHDDPGGRSGVPPAQGIDWYELRTRSGTVVRSAFLVGGGSPPKMPDEISLSPALGADNSKYFTVSSVDGSTRYRVRASTDPGAGNGILLVASSLQGAYSTLHRLLLIELLVALGVLGGIAAVGLWVVRLGLRPLREIESTAATIAAGDLSQRVERAEPETEVGRLGLSLNAMLAQIESAFDARRESERRLRQFVADASHELRTPLAAVRAYAELFGRGASSRPEDLSRSMTGITREAERMSLLVEDLLLLARLDEGRPLEREPVDFAAVVGEAVDAARVLDPDRPLEVSLEAVTVLGDRDRLRQVIDNLLSNIRAHTPAETAVRIGLHEADGTAELRVSDAGPGFSEEEGAQLFERFYRVDSSRTRASGGVGLGLSIVAAVARAHGGTVAARPTPGGGATIVVTLPTTPA